MKPAVICQPLSKFDIFTFYIFSDYISATVTKSKFDAKYVNTVRY